MLILSLCDCWLDLSGQRWDSLHVSLTEYISIKPLEPVGAGALRFA